MQGTYTLTEDDTIAAYRLYFLAHTFSRKGLWQIAGFLCWVAAFGIGTGAFIAYRNQASTLEAIGIMTGVLLSCFLLFLVWMAFAYHRHRSAGREYLRLGGLNGVEIHWRSDEHGHEAHTKHIQTRLAWGDYHGWSEDAQVLLLYIAPAQFQIKPKRAIAAADIDAMRNRLIAAGVGQLAPLR